MRITKNVCAPGFDHGPSLLRIFEGNKLYVICILLVATNTVTTPKKNEYKMTTS